MSINNIDDTVDDDIILFNIAEAESKQPFFDMTHFVGEITPENLSTMDRVIRGEDVDRREIQKIIRILSDKLVPLYNRDGSLDDPNMVQLHEMLVDVGRQL